MAGRTLRSKRLRAALWYAAEGCCQHCGVSLGADWEADHIQPWRLTGRTNVHEMQALCPPCNRAKGGAMLQPRLFQQQALALREEVLTGRLPLPREIGGYIVPGGGKQSLAAILADMALQAGADRVCWDVPNGSLRHQGAQSVLRGGTFEQLTGRTLRLFENKNEPNPAKDGDGYIVTTHAVAANPDLHLQEFQRHRYVLIRDEGHHLSFKETTSHAVAMAPLVEAAYVNVYLSGELDRHDRNPIAFLRYIDGYVDTQDTEQSRWFVFPRSKALQEQAIIPVHLTLSDGPARWRADGQEETAERLGRNKQALWTVLKTEFAETLLQDTVAHWRAYRREHPQSKLLVVCGFEVGARQAVRALRRMGIACAKATYEDDRADDVIKAFRDGTVPPVLVTIAKAYEGMDVPSVTHLACLTHIRSRQWIEQMLARTWRYDAKGGPWETQQAFIWAPNDDFFIAIKERIEAEEVAAVREERDTPRGPVQTDAGPPTLPVIAPVDSALTEQRAAVLGGEWLSVAETGVYKEAGAQYGLSAMQVRDLLRVVDAARAAVTVAVSNGHTTWRPLTPQEELKAAKTELTRVVNEAARKASDGTPADIAAWNIRIRADVKGQFGMTAPEMPPGVVDAATAWVRRVYAIPT